ncbi:hypothetical protein [Demequina salsinemoris]|uniref:hypothetical protein n=1 Tax=Demequina salsinemoris TaxID=577470 RepID=UPI0007824702|nr:hypothetical protein [Demequina salsinemoris]
MKTRTLTAVVAFGCTAALLAGCSSSDADTTASASASAGTETSADDGADAAMPEASGLTGEISYVSDDTAQVQDDSSQTAVTWTDDTTITQEVEISLADIDTGACVVVTLADDGTTASTISVTEADDDGSCATAMGGGMGGGDMADGDAPTDMPTDMADGDMPTDMPTAAADGDAPTDMPTDMAGGGDFDTTSMVNGTVTAVGDATLTVETTDGDETTVDIDDDSAITGTEDADSDAIEVGMCMTATGESDDSGNYAATDIYVFSADDEGCVTTSGFGGGMGGGMPSGDAPTDESGE